MPRSTGSRPIPRHSRQGLARYAEADLACYRAEGPQPWSSVKASLGCAARLGAAALRCRLSHHIRADPRRPAVRDGRPARPCRRGARSVPPRRACRRWSPSADRWSRRWRCSRRRSAPRRRGARSASTSAGNSSNGGRTPRRGRCSKTAGAISLPPRASWSCLTGLVRGPIELSDEGPRARSAAPASSRSAATIARTSARHSSVSRLTSTYSYSGQWLISPAARAIRSAITSAVSVPRLCSRRSSSGIDGGRMKMVTRSSPNRRLELLGALPIDVEQDVAAFAERVLHRRLGGSVAIAEHRRPFDEFASLDHAVELGVVDEMIIDIVDLARAASAGWSRRPTWSPRRRRRGASARSSICPRLTVRKGRSAGRGGGASAGRANRPWPFLLPPSRARQAAE